MANIETDNIIIRSINKMLYNVGYKPKFILSFILCIVNVINHQPEVACMQNWPICQTEQNNSSSQSSTNDEMKNIKRLWKPMPLSPPSPLMSPIIPKVIRGYNYPNVKYTNSCNTNKIKIINLCND